MYVDYTSTNITILCSTFMTDPPHRHSHYPQPTSPHLPTLTSTSPIPNSPLDHRTPHSHEACRPYDLKVGSVIERDQSHLEEFEVRTTPHHPSLIVSYHPTSPYTNPLISLHSLCTHIQPINVSSNISMNTSRSSTMCCHVIRSFDVLGLQTWSYYENHSTKNGRNSKNAITRDHKLTRCYY